MVVTIRREIWASKEKKKGATLYTRRVIFTARDDKGRIKGWIKQKGTKLNLNSARDKYKKANSFKSDIISYTPLSPYTGLYTTSKRVYPAKHTQTVVEFQVIKNGRVMKKTIYGYSKLMDKKDDMNTIKNTALKNGINDGLFTYDDEIVLVPKNTFYQSFKRL